MSFGFFDEPPPGYKRDIKDLVKKFSKSEIEINKSIESVLKNPTDAEEYRGFENLDVRKFKAPITHYDISKRQGLRFIYFVIEKTVFPLLVYHRHDAKNQKNTNSKIKERMNWYKEIIPLFTSKKDDPTR